jgi:hypothetical protein
MAELARLRDEVAMLQAQMVELRREKVSAAARSSDASTTVEAATTTAAAQQALPLAAAESCMVHDHVAESADSPHIMANSRALKRRELNSGVHYHV